MSKMSGAGYLSSLVLLMSLFLLSQNPYRKLAINMLCVKSNNYISLEYDNFSKEEFVGEEPVGSLKKSRLEEESD